MNDIEALMQALHGPMPKEEEEASGRLNNPPDGGKVRQSDSQTKPWKDVGMSRATWYRHGKPYSDDRKYYSQRGRAKIFGSVRTVQRIAFVRRYGVPELNELWLDDLLLPIAMLEEVAKWDGEYQKQFVDRVLELVATCPKIKPSDDEWLQRSPITARCCEIGRNQLVRVAKQAFNEVDAKAWADAIAVVETAG